ncbi:hemolysin family protein [Culicoidibacter larvae]|uniref:HlyC/CorC family transporter n=1 Tax=Culicoidibacter larvae TaxID=2579976 RepID=A0A5R8QD64_9FIRM|nr:hemolysin family protein [Culicoidibacter larvae]TLG73923.1 HlyC/CorC family transporter [Culicoidibacter larvae]
MGIDFDPSSIWLLAAIMILIIFSAFFSASEIAFSSVNRVRLRNYAEQGRHNSKLALQMAEDFGTLITTVLIGNNIVNILISTLATALFTKLFGVVGVAYSVVVITIVILIFGEIFPKALAKEYAEGFCIKAAPILKFFIIILKPLSIIFGSIQKLLHRLRKNTDAQPSVTEEELMSLVDAINEEGYIDDEKKDLIRSAIEFNDTPVSEIYVPRVDVFAVNVNDEQAKIVKQLLENHFSRVPVYDESIDNIVGILYERDYLSALVQNKNTKIAKLIKPATFVSAAMKVDDALALMQKNKAHMAIVIDEYGGMAGILTMEDILEELVGEIYDEYDDVVSFVEKVDDHVFKVNGDLNLEDLFEKYLSYPNVPSSEYNTVSGWVFESIQGIPEVGLSFDYESIHVEIIKVDNRRVSEVLLTMHDDYRSEDVAEEADFAE